MDEKRMIREIKSHPVAYTLLIAILLLSVMAFLAAWPNVTMQRGIAVAMGVLYGVWGVITHVKADHVTRNVVVEYLVVGLLASTLLILVTV